MEEQNQCPAYAQRWSVHGSMAYQELTRLCSRCGYPIAYDGAADEPDSDCIHMGLDADYRDNAEAHFDLARKLARRLFWEARQHPELLTDLGLPAPQAAENITEEMIVNTWAIFLDRYVFLCEWQAMLY